MKFDEENILLDLSVTSKTELFKVIADYAQSLNYIENTEKVSEAFLDREKEFSTGLQDGFAIPHAKSEFVLSPTVFFIRLKKPLSWETFDGTDVKHLFALLAAKKNAGTVYLKMLSNLSQALLEEEFIHKIKGSVSKEELVVLINKEMIGEEIK
ncbi:PTS sugar transporter subunit IIA [Tetragenococcus koreensis]|uniref:Fructose/mannitol-specific PTS system IIA component n=1 Tax=Tetragenococcus koreensis TaxID=290335 RepID=A0AAN4UCZ3_9ENTE|nr:PTS sugar transporter subunit IIA [Tetragenococcus koreensis]AYW46581.1 PTS mannose transporter subunit IIAB [Tetragenococcus koreensis]MCF1585615.1 PTS sugar transporter subunit IIA [Tetragenococcus koreensis]MCF1615189.1 PTS sugar transporter subunit IIA [Tetragenococcus koreensis]MCF1617896.1 PTS sugar transporter subunit IIA [Tetragenococcus koreensis]MCF1620220.1 PTS sugar transporter subunit IIA [Tetragenococcus koreensis]